MAESGELLDMLIFVFILAVYNYQPFLCHNRAKKGCRQLVILPILP